MSRLRSRVPGKVQRGEPERNETRDPAQESRSAICCCGSVPLGPGLAALARDTRGGARHRGARMSRWPWSYSRCQTAQCYSFPRRVAAPGFVCLFAGAFTLAHAGRAHGGLWRRRPSRLKQFRPPDEGWMERRQTHSLVSVAPATRDHLVPGRPGPLSALHRGDFGYGPTKPAPAVEPEPAATARARHCRPAVGVRTSLRCGSRRSGGRHSWLRLAGSFLENAPLSQDTNRCIINAIRSQYLIRVVVDTCISAREGAARPAERRNVPA